MTNEAELTSPSAKEPSTLLHPVWLTLGALGLALAAQLVVRWRLPLPPCLMRKYTGFPCPSCGCTRSLLAWSHLDPISAFRFNPLFSLVVTSLLFWLLAWSAERISGKRFLAGWRSRLARLPYWKILIAMAIANWLYLCAKLPP
ncbi:MAG: hypothetical protein QOF48_3180 [Verrucomicrobiota bacterium]|jgi:hypothetical protein